MKTSWCMICLAALAVPTALRGQVEGLPIKPGLWENSSTTQGGVGGGRTVTRQACYTGKMSPEQYVAQLAQQAPGFQCTVSNLKVTAHTISMDESCSGQGMNAKSHVEVSTPDPEHMIANNHMEMSGSMQGRPMDMKMDSKIEGKFISPDCGSVKPLALPTAPPK